jgi:hypothetical protein
MPFKVAGAVGFGRPFGTAPIEPQREIARRTSRSLPNGVKQRRRSGVSEHRGHRSLAAVVSCAFTRIGTCRFCIDERAGTRIAFFKRGPSSRDGAISKEGKPNEIENSLSPTGHCCSPRIDAACGGARHVRRDRCHCIHSRQRSEGSRTRARSYEHYHRIDSASAQCFQGNDNPPWPKPDATEVEQARKQVFSHSDLRPPSGGLCLCATSTRT